MKKQPLLGFLFALITAMAWGSLPIALKQVLSVMTPQTIVWYRFIVAFLALFILLAYKKKLPQFSKVVDSFGLCSLVSLDYRVISSYLIAHLILLILLQLKFLFIFLLLVC